MGPLEPFSLGAISFIHEFLLPYMIANWVDQSLKCTQKESNCFFWFASELVRSLTDTTFKAFQALSVLDRDRNSTHLFIIFSMD